MKIYIHDNCGGEVSRDTLICDICKTRPSGNEVIKKIKQNYNTYTASRRMERMFGDGILDRPIPGFPRD